VNYARIIIAGHLTRDVELKYTASEMAIASCGVAVNKKHKDRDDTVMYLDVTLFGKRAEAFERFHSKGSAVFLEGDLTQDHWEDRETGQKRSKIKMNANNWEFMDQPQKEKNPFDE